MVRAHPRVCGENEIPTTDRVLCDGSSPRVRGKRIIFLRLLRLVRLIPACAGKTPPPKSRSSTARAHPRVCGENRNWKRLYQGRAGSSPRVRGKRVTTSRHLTYFRLIPACAGKTLTLREAARLQTAHPRVCGENIARIFSCQEGKGSSPRVRGKRPRRSRLRRRLGLIPACAGKTSLVTGAGDRGGAHPRVCGENLGEMFRSCSRLGSSPRVRGKH